MIYFGLKPIAKFLRMKDALAFSSSSMSQVIKSLFANNEQGFAFDFNDLSTMYQDSAGTIPVTGVGQPVGLVLDKSKGLVLGNEKWIDANTVIAGQSQILGGGKYRIYSPDGAKSYISVSSGLEPNKMYEAIFTIESISGMISVVGSPDVNFSTTGKKRCVFSPLNSSLVIKRTATCDAIISSVSVRELPGNHATQSTSAKRPILKSSPTQLNYDGIDDVMTVNLPSQLTGCTVIRAVPNVGTQILTNQTISAPYSDSTTNSGLIVINRALTSEETTRVTQVFNKLAGV